MQRFDEVELQAVSGVGEFKPAAVAKAHDDSAPRLRRLLALLTDLSLFVALALALSPLLPPVSDWMATTALFGFVLLFSFYYLVGSWLLWGKTIGGTIFDVRVVSDSEAAMSMASATLRWLGCLASLLTGGLGFLMALTPAARSLPDRISGTHCVGA